MLRSATCLTLVPRAAALGTSHRRGVYWVQQNAAFEGSERVDECPESRFIPS